MVTDWGGSTTVLLACGVLALCTGCRGDLYEAAREGNAGRVHALLDGGADPNQQSEGSTTLTAAAAAGQADVVKLLLDRGADPNLLNEAGFSPLFGAVRSDDLPTVLVLLEHGADPGLWRERGISALGEAAFHGRADMVRAMLDAGARVDGPTAAAGYTAWQVASNMEVTALLIERGASYPLKDPAAWDAKLQRAAEAGQCGAVVVYAGYPAVRQTEAELGWPAFRLAAARGHVDLLRLLAARGADVNARGPDGRTALHEAAQNGMYKTAEWLLARGADRNTPDAQGFSPLDLATQQKHSLLVQLLSAPTEGD